MASEFIKELLKIKEDADEVAADDLKIDDQVHNQLDKAGEDDDVDAQCFGLEMEDGKVVKVYVKQEDAEEFEKALSIKLGDEDDIKAAIEELEKDFEIIEVVWPDEDDSDGEDDDEDDPDYEGKEAPDDGSESLNGAVDYTDTTPKKEALSIGQRFTKKLTELKWTDDEHSAYKAVAAKHGDDDEASDEGQKDDETVTSTASSPDSKWKVEKDEDGGMMLANDRFKLDLDEDETLELASKIADKQIARFKNEQGKIVYVFTPRGSDYLLKTPEFQGGFKIPASILTQIVGDDSE